MDLTTVFTPRSECLSTYTFSSWQLLRPSSLTALYLVGEFQVRSSIVSDGTTFNCIPQGGKFSDVPYFSPGLSCPSGWATQNPSTGDETTTTVYCCPRTLTLDVGTANVLSCVATVVSDALWYQLETEDATTHSEINLPQTFDAERTIVSAEVHATPLILVWESTDNPRPPTATATTNTQQKSHTSLSSGAVAAISASAALSVILLIVAYLFYKSSKRRSSNNDPQPGVSAEKMSDLSKPGEGAKAGMEDHLPAQGPFTQGGAYRAMPELGSEANYPCHASENHINADMNLSHLSKDQSAVGSSPGDGINSVSVGAHPAELE